MQTILGKISEIESVFAIKHPVSNITIILMGEGLKVRFLSNLIASKRKKSSFMNSFDKVNIISFFKSRNTFLETLG